MHSNRWGTKHIYDLAQMEFIKALHIQDSIKKNRFAVHIDNSKAKVVLEIPVFLNVVNAMSYCQRAVDCDLHISTLTRFFKMPSYSDRLDRGVDIPDASKILKNITFLPISLRTFVNTNLNRIDTGNI